MAFRTPPVLGEPRGRRLYFTLGPCVNVRSQRGLGGNKQGGGGRGVAVLLSCCSAVRQLPVGEGLRGVYDERLPLRMDSKSRAAIRRRSSAKVGLGSLLLRRGVMSGS